MSYRVLVSAPYFQPVVKRFAEVFKENRIETFIAPVEERLSVEQLLPLVGDIHGTICGDDAYTDEVLACAQNLRVISKWGTGIDSIDLESCRKRGIVVCNTPNAFTEPVADTTLGYILMHVRGLKVLDDYMKAGGWQKQEGRSLSECVVGIIGLGNIGRAVARRLSSFKAHILGNDLIVPPQIFCQDYGVEMVSKNELLQRSDVVTLHCDLNPTSYHIIDTAALKNIKPSAFLINTARGKLIDELSLIRALQEKQLAGAALDVFENEPLLKESPLRVMPQVLLSPHSSNSSHKAWEIIHQKTVENLLQYLRKV